MDRSVHPFSQERVELARQSKVLSKKERGKLSRARYYERRFKLPAKDLKDKEVQTEEAGISSVDDTIRSLRTTICNLEQELEALRQRRSEQVLSSGSVSDAPQKVRV